MTKECGMNIPVQLEGEEVIVVDDMPDFTRNLSNLLSLDDIELKVFNRPEEFLNYSNDKRFKACKFLVVDYSMPNLTGYDVFKELFEITEGYMPFEMVLYTANLHQISESEKDYMKSLNIKLMSKPNIQELVEKILERVE